ncbi:MAG: hypothetical protein WCI72_01100 [archaeon]
MYEIFFPTEYKKAVLNGTKNSTIRVKKETGRYKVGKIYSAMSYAGKDWNIKVKILKVTKTKIGELAKAGIPEKNINSLNKKEKIFPNDRVEIIKFKTI